MLKYYDVKLMDTDVHDLIIGFGIPIWIVKARA